MGIADFFKNVKALLAYSRKADREQLSAYAKLFLLSLILIGGIGLVVHLVAFWLSVR